MSTVKFDLQCGYFGGSLVWDLLCIKFWVKLSRKINALVNRYRMEKFVSLFRMLQVNFRENRIRISTQYQKQIFYNHSSVPSLDPNLVFGNSAANADYTVL